MRRLASSPILLIAAVLAVLCHVAPARAHEIRPALLDITETSPGWFDVTWKVPMRGDLVLAINPMLPPSLEPVGPPSARVIPGASVQRLTCRGDAAALVGQEIFIDGLAALQIDVLLHIDLANGDSHSAIVRPSNPSYTVPARATKGEVSWAYTRMGVIHILEGIDHLLFLVAMLLLVTGFWRLLKTITAFTIAHSVTLALATLGLVNVPSAPTEAIISLSIVFVAVEVIRKQRGQAGFTERNPWTVAFFFGLFHGLGFAGALSEIGVPAHEVPLALLMFNVGVEAGQIVFVTAVACLLGLLRRIPRPSRFPDLNAAPTVTYLIGGIAAFWTIQRVVSFV